MSNEEPRQIEFGHSSREYGVDKAAAGGTPAIGASEATDKYIGMVRCDLQVCHADTVYALTVQITEGIACEKTATNYPNSTTINKHVYWPSHALLTLLRPCHESGPISSTTTGLYNKLTKFCKSLVNAAGSRVHLVEKVCCVISRCSTKKPQTNHSRSSFVSSQECTECA